jgi:hypothetical protein
VSQADGEGQVVPPCDLSARCTTEALLFVGVTSPPILPFGASTPPEEDFSTSPWPMSSLRRGLR